MTDHDNSQGEPTMEEILASIRRIISEDNEEGGDAESQSASKREAAGSEPAKERTETSSPEGEAEVLELSPSQMVPGERAEPSSAAREESGTSDAKPNGFDMSASTPEPERKFTAFSGSASENTSSAAKSEAASGDSVKGADADIGKEVEETLLSPEVATAAAAAFGALSKDVTVSGAEGAKSLEELVKDMMKPMLKDWLDDNLPPLVEEVVEREVRRLSHRRVRR